MPVEVNALLDEVVQTLRPRFAETGVEPSLQLGPHIPKFSLDANQVEQIFMGLITNALEATPKGGSVTIPIENRQKVFEPFFTTKSYGTGIGLPLAKKFVERNGGTIEISNSNLGGAKIDVTFHKSN